MKTSRVGGEEKGEMSVGGRTEAIIHRWCSVWYKWFFKGVHKNSEALLPSLTHTNMFYTYIGFSPPQFHSFLINVVLKAIYIHLLKVINLCFMTFTRPLPCNLLKVGFTDSWFYRCWFSTVFDSKKAFLSSCSAGIFRCHTDFHCGCFTIIIRNTVFSTSQAGSALLHYYWTHAWK